MMKIKCRWTLLHNFCCCSCTIMCIVLFSSWKEVSASNNNRLFGAAAQLKIVDSPRYCDITDFRCANGNCISATLRCNNADNCGDNSDEILCATTKASDLCALSSRHSCESTIFECYSPDEKCDGIAQCSNGADELNCGKCFDYQIKCEVGPGCIYQSQLCDGVPDCLSGSDEEYCTAENCIKRNGGFLCSNDKCIHLGALCDRVWHCIDGDDESNCEDRTAGGSSRGTYDRAETKKVPQTLLTAVLISVFVCSAVLGFAFSCVCYYRHTLCRKPSADETDDSELLTGSSSDRSRSARSSSSASSGSSTLVRSPQLGPGTTRGSHLGSTVAGGGGGFLHNLATRHCLGGGGQGTGRRERSQTRDPLVCREAPPSYAVAVGAESREPSSRTIFIPELCAGRPERVTPMREALLTREPRQSVGASDGLPSYADSVHHSQHQLDLPGHTVVSPGDDFPSADDGPPAAIQCCAARGRPAEDEQGSMPALLGSGSVISMGPHSVTVATITVPEYTPMGYLTDCSDLENISLISRNEVGDA